MVDNEISEKLGGTTDISKLLLAAKQRIYEECLENGLRLKDTDFTKIIPANADETGLLTPEYLVAGASAIARLKTETARKVIFSLERALKVYERDPDRKPISVLGLTQGAVYGFDSREPMAFTIPYLVDKAFSECTDINEDQLKHAAWGLEQISFVVRDEIARGKGPQSDKEHAIFMPTWQGNEPELARLDKVLGTRGRG